MNVKELKLNNNEFQRYVENLKDFSPDKLDEEISNILMAYKMAIKQIIPTQENDVNDFFSLLRELKKVNQPLAQEIDLILSDTYDTKEEKIVSLIISFPF